MNAALVMLRRLRVASGNSRQQAALERAAAAADREAAAIDRELAAADRLEADLHKLAAAALEEHESDPVLAGPADAHAAYALDTEAQSTG